MEKARPGQRRYTANRNFKQRNFRSNQPNRTRYYSRRALQPIDPSRIPIASRLAHRAFADGGIFHLGPHRVQIVRSRNHRKQQNQRASESEQTLQRGQPAHRSRSPAPPPQPVGRKRQQQPCEIEQQLHFQFLVSSWRKRCFEGANKRRAHTPLAEPSFSEIPNSSQRDHGTAVNRENRKREPGSGSRALRLPAAPSEFASARGRWHCAWPPPPPG